MRYSFIIPVYNRPEEIDALLASIAVIGSREVEVIVVEDGSSEPCNTVCAKYADRLELLYLSKENGGPGKARNYGAEHAKGDYLVFLDSDVIMPQGYISALDEELAHEVCDAFGGPDRAMDSFTTTQKAINYSMTSFLTTGGIRGGHRKLDKFYPRSFNMGIRREKFLALDGFSSMRFGEDIDLSLRIYGAGLRCRLFPEAWVWHKRRANLRQFYKQVYNSGIARIALYKRYPQSLKAVHTLPGIFAILVIAAAAVFIAGCITLAVSGNCFAARAMIGVPAFMALLFSTIICTDSAVRNGSIEVGLMSIAASVTQLMGYGLGFWHGVVHMLLLKRNNVTAFGRTFYD